MTEAHEANGPPGPPAGRVSGRYVVFAILAFAAVFLACTYLLAVRLTPAAEKWRGEFRQQASPKP